MAETNQLPRSHGLQLFTLFALLTASYLACARGVARDPTVEREIAVDCEITTSIPSELLVPMTRQIMSEITGHPSSLRWGEKAFNVDLDHDGVQEYLMPLECSDVGNCVWGIFAGRSAQLVAKLDAVRIYVHESASGWSPLTTYSNLGEGQGAVSQLVFSGRKYTHTSSRFLSGRNAQAFLTFMHHASCPSKSHGAT